MYTISTLRSGNTGKKLQPILGPGLRFQWWGESDRISRSRAEDATNSRPLVLLGVKKGNKVALLFGKQARVGAFVLKTISFRLQASASL